MVRAQVYPLHCSPRQRRWVHYLPEDFLQPIDRTVLLSVDRRVQHCARETAETERVVEENKAGSQTAMTAHETGPTRMTMTIFRKTQKTVCSTLLKPLSHTRENVCVCNVYAVFSKKRGGERTESRQSWKAQGGWRESSSSDLWKSRQCENCHAEALGSSKGCDRTKQESAQQGVSGLEVAATVALLGRQGPGVADTAEV